METTEKETIQKGFDLHEEQITVFKKIRGTVCHHCPFCRYARKNPDSVIGRLHHTYHAENCSFWNAEKELYGESKEMTSPKVKAHMLWKAF